MTEDKKRVFIIAEAGVNHNGSLKIAKKLIDLAKECGVNAIKFQTWKTENVVTKNAKKASYQSNTDSLVDSQYSMLKKLELSYSDFIDLKKYSDYRKIEFLSTADEIESANFLNNLQNKFKIGSAELTDWPYLEKVAKFGKQIILSTGLGNLKEIEDAINVITNSGLPKEKIIVLHANTAYPTPYCDVNLKAMQTISKKLNVKVGYSDHTKGIEVSLAAVALGARVIEKHFTLDKNMEGPDHKASLEPYELKKLVESIRNIEDSLGNGRKVPSKSELENIEVVRKSIVAKTEIKEGDVFTEKNISVKRPMGGLSPTVWNKVIGKRAKKNFLIDEFIIL